VKQVDNATSHIQRYITIPNILIKNIGSLGGVDAFRFYATIQLNKNWSNGFICSPGILLHLLNREKQYLQKQLRQQMQILNHNGFIALDKDINIVGLNDVIAIHVQWVEGGFTKIFCVNEKIFELPSPVNVNTLFAVYASLCVVANQVTGYFYYPSENLINRLNLSEKTVLRALQVLDESGYISIRRGPYDPIKKQRVCNQYRVHNYGDLWYQIKMGLTSMPDTVRLNNENEIEITNQIARVISSPDDYTPCLFKNATANKFIDYCYITERSLIFSVEKIRDMEMILEDYGGVMDFPSGVFIIHLLECTDGIESLLLNFLHISTLPVIIVTNGEISNNRLKAKIKTIYS
jgi:DNA-binding Lrp family transcriptional regulator